MLSILIYRSTLRIQPRRITSSTKWAIFLRTFKMAGLKMTAACVGLVFALIVAVEAGGRTLVLVDNWSIRETHSSFFRSLRGLYFLQSSMLINVTWVTGFQLEDGGSHCHVCTV